MTLDGQGAARVTVPDIPKIEQPSVLNAEMDYADANGEILTAAGRVDLWPSAVTLGIRREGWVASTEQMRFRVVALDLDGHPIAGQRVDVALYSASDYSYRKRLIGGFYAYDSVREMRTPRRELQRQNRRAGTAAVRSRARRCGRSHRRRANERRRRQPR